MFSALLWIVLLAPFITADNDGKRWVWSSARRTDSDRLYTGVASGSSHTSALVAPSKSLFKPATGFEDSIVPQSTKLRYEVSEELSEYPKPPRPSIYPEEQYRPMQTTVNGYRPDPIRPTNTYRPPNRPTSSGVYRPPEDSYRPQDNFRPGQGSGYRPQTGSGYRPTNGPNGRPILTGPVPSWEQDDVRYKEYDRCKCVHSFNCNSPGIQFGSCDVDKQYCCYKDVNSNRPRPSDDRVRPVLAGPGGPVDRPGLYRPSSFNSDRFQDRPSRPYINNDRYSKGYKDSTFGSGTGSGLEQAYKKGLESAIHEIFETPNRYDNRREYPKEFQRDDLSNFNRRPSQNSKYGLYQGSSDFYGGRSTNSTILSEKQP